MNKPLTPDPRARVVLQVLVLIAVVAFGLWALYQIASVLLVLIVAALFAYVIAPLVQLAERPIHLRGRSRRLSRGSAIAVVYLLTATVSAGAALLLPTVTLQLDEMISNTPRYAESILRWEQGWSSYYQLLRIPIELRQRIDQSVISASGAAVESAREALLALVGALISHLPWLVLTPVLAFFFLRDVASFRRTILTALPHRIQLRSHRLFEELDAALAAYTRAQLLACVLVGCVCGVGFAVLGIPYPVLLAVLASVLEFIPLVGPLLLATVASIVGALHAPSVALWAVGFLGGLRLVEDYVIYPRLIRRGIQLHPVAVIVPVLSGAELDGVAGMFLAVPTVAILSVVYRHWQEWRGDTDVDPSQPAPDAARRP
jgi:predicted PurR-regulated permease PerM